MMVFIDTSAWYAFFDRSDDNHNEAVECFQNRWDLITSSIVVHETIALCQRRLTSFSTNKVGEFIFNSNLINIIIPTLSQEKKAWNKFMKRKISNISFVDISNKIIIEDNKLEYIFAFDDDFEKLGLKMVP